MKTKRLIALCPVPMHDEFMEMATRSGESAAVLIRSLVADAIERARRGEPVMPRLRAEASLTRGG